MLLETHHQKYGYTDSTRVEHGRLLAFMCYLACGVCEVLRTPTTVLLVAVARCISVCGILELATGWLDVRILRTGWNTFIACDMLPKSVSL